MRTVVSATPGRGARADRLLLVGTDTGIGKTWLGCALAHALRASGCRVVAVKPVETGCRDTPSPEEDGVRLARATGQIEPAHALVRLGPPVAPAVALEAAGRALDRTELVRWIEGYVTAGEFLLVEGVGGLLSPITWEWNALDLALALDARVLVVGPDRIGVINQSLLTLQVLGWAGIPVLGVVLTGPAVPDASTGTNAHSIARLSGIERVIGIGHHPDPRTACSTVVPVLQWIEGCELNSPCGS